MENKSEVKPLYEELKGILEQLPIVSEDKMYLKIWDKNVWEGYFEVLDLLSQQLGEDFSRFKIEPKYSHEDSYSIELLSLRQKISKAIKYIGSKYLELDFDEKREGAGIFINQSQSQQQEFYLTVSLQLMEKTMEMLQSEGNTDLERGFLEELKNNLTKYSNIISLFGGILELMSQFGVTPEFVKSLFS